MGPGLQKPVLTFGCFRNRWYRKKFSGAPDSSIPVTEAQSFQDLIRKGPFSGTQVIPELPLKKIGQPMIG